MKTISPALRRAVSRACRHNMWRNRYDHLAYKAKVKARFEDCAENGKIAVFRSGRDCDGVSYIHVDHIDVPGVAEWLRDEDEHARWLDGPENVSIFRPSTCPEHNDSWGGWE